MENNKKDKMKEALEILESYDSECPPRSNKFLEGGE